MKNHGNQIDAIISEKKACYLCVNHIDKVDYKDTLFLRKFMNSQAKIIPPRRTGICSCHQRVIARAIKRARNIALLSFLIK